MAKRAYEVWCHTCGCLMKLREGKYGKFYGCTGYPKCFNTLNVKDAALQVDEEETTVDEVGRPLDIDKDYDPDL